MTSGIGAVLIGALFMLIGFGKARVSKNPEANAAFIKKWGPFFRIAGPVLVLGGIAIWVLSL